MRGVEDGVRMARKHCGGCIGSARALTVFITLNLTMRVHDQKAGDNEMAGKPRPRFSSS